MKPSFRQHLLKWRTLFGAITLLCLLWHILLPTMVHTGIAPTLYAMPTHCQVTEIKNSMQMSHAHMSHHQHAMHDMQHLQDSKTTQLSAHEQEVFALAAQIMKHCPLCNYGLDDAVIMPLLAFIIILLMAWFGRVRCLCASWREQLYLPKVHYISPTQTSATIGSINRKFYQMTSFISHLYPSCGAMLLIPLHKGELKGVRKKSTYSAYSCGTALFIAFL